MLLPCLDLLDAETAHEAALRFLSVCQSVPPVLGLLKACYGRHAFVHPELNTRVADLDFPNPIGLAAGWDKNARVPLALSSLGFGFLELGTVTCWPESGHPKPRIFRSHRDQWIINRVGFANDGADSVRGRLQKLPHLGGPILGLSLGKMLFSPPERLMPEAVRMMELFYPYAAFFSVNVSSPNTPRGFLMGRPDFLREMLGALKRSSRDIGLRLGRVGKPLFVKISPTLNKGEIETLAEVLRDSGVDGVIATNTMATPQGGLSGLPLKAAALKTTARLYASLKGEVPVIGVGGILTPEDAWQRITAGASLIQMFSGFVFSGPSLIRRISRMLSSQLAQHGFKNIREAVGIHAERYA